MFGTHIGDHKRSGRAVLARALRGKYLLDWYWAFPRDPPLMHNEDEEYRTTRLEIRKAAARGAAAAPQKGKGKK